MKYTDLDINMGFFRNMRETEWLKLFPHWWSETDPLLQAIGKEVETIKAQAIFDLLNTAFKPPVLLWQESVIEPKYVVTKTLTNIPTRDSNTSPEQEIEIQAPRYKTWGTIKITNNSSDILSSLQIQITDKDYVTIHDNINPDDELFIDLKNQRYYINDDITDNYTIKNDGLSYFKVRKRSEHDQNDDLHKEVLKIQFFSPKSLIDTNIEIEVTLKDVVFYDEQNVELNTFELIPLKSVKLFAYYDFPYNKTQKGWRQVWAKTYKDDTIVLHDMITSHLFTKKFYVEVEYKGLDFPYKVGFPCYRDAEEGSEYHVNSRLDKWGEYFGLKRRLYREDIPEEEYSQTFPPYYPFDIEQDYWYYKRLADEYAWNNLAINDIDVIDTNNNPVLRLHSVDPFIQDLAVHVKSIYPQERENIDYSMLLPIYVTQNDAEADYKRCDFEEIYNLLSYDNNKAFVTLRNYYGYNITGQKNKSKELETFFDLSSLPEDINIDDIKILIEAEATDNATNKYSNDETGLIIPGISDTKLFKLVQSDSYELEEKEIEYTLVDGIKAIKKMIEPDANIKQTAIVGKFIATKGSYLEIPFELQQYNVDKDEMETIDDITEVYVTFDGIGTYQGEYHKVKNKEDKEISYIRVHVPKDQDYSQMSIVCKTELHQSFTSIKIKLVNYEQENGLQTIYGPILNKSDDDIAYTTDKSEYIQQPIKISDDWHTGDLRNILYQDGIKFINVYQNDDITNIPTIVIKNIRLKVSYSKKETNYELNTQIINYKDDKKGIVSQLEVIVSNQSDKYISPQVDIVCEENLKLQIQTDNELELEKEKTYCSFREGLNIGESVRKIINIYADKPIIDGRYEILTTSEDKIARDYIYLFSEGLIRTKVNLEQHFAIYNKDITLMAEVINQRKSEMGEGDGTVSFYIDDYLVGKSNIDTVLVGNTLKNIATITVTSKDYLISGILPLEARYSGSSKYSSSRSHNFILISQYDTKIEFIDFQEKAAYDRSYKSKVHVTYIDENGEEKLLDPASEKHIVNFYIDDEFIGDSEIDEYGYAEFTLDQIKYLAGTHIFTAEYQGIEAYANKKISREFIIFGGPTTTQVFPRIAKQLDTVKLIAQITDTNNEGVTQGIATFSLRGDINKHEDDIITPLGEVQVKNGAAVLEYTIPDTVLTDDPDDVYVYDIIVEYIDEQDVYKPSEGESTLTIQREEVILEGEDIFYVSVWEPLGFYLTVKDKSTGLPITVGNIQLSIPGQAPLINDPIFEDIVDPDGGARLLYYPINFSMKDFARLIKMIFQQRTGNQLYPRQDPVEIEDKDLICIYKGFDITQAEIDEIIDTEEEIDEDFNIARRLLMDLMNDETVRKYLPWFHIKTTTDEDGKETECLYITTNEEFEQIIIKENGSLYIWEDTPKKVPELNYKTGVFDATFTYLQSAQYKMSEPKKAQVSFKKGSHDVLTIAYDIQYGDEPIECYLSEYDEENEELFGDDVDNTNARQYPGVVNFYIDDKKVSQEVPDKNLVKLPLTVFQGFSIGNHLLHTEYIPGRPDINTHSYNRVSFNPITSLINVDIDRQVPGKISTITVTIDTFTEQDVRITGPVDIYINGEKVGSIYLLGIEGDTPIINTLGDGREMVIGHTTTATFEIPMPDDLGTTPYEITIVYGGNQYIEGSEITIELEKQMVDLTIEANDYLTIAEGEAATLRVEVESPYNEYINEGYIVLQQGSDNIIVKEVVKNNIAYLEWTPQGQVGDVIPYYLNYTGSDNYKIQQVKPISVEIVEHQPEVWISQEIRNKPFYFDNFEEAQKCVEDGGIIHIVDSFNMEKDIIINKNVNILGTNSSKIIKDANSILREDSIKIHNFSEFDETLFVIEGLTLDDITNLNFIIQNKELFITNKNILTPIFLLDDGLFYAYKSINLSSIKSIINLVIEKGNVNIDNVYFETNDNGENNFEIHNKGNLKITKSIINEDVIIKNSGKLIINESLVYGNISGLTKDINLDNNWWGTNTPTRSDINNYIILELYSYTTPIIGDDIEIAARLIGKNGIMYDLPPQDFYFTSQSGYFSISSGQLVDCYARTTYIDGDQEEIIYCHVDNEQVGLQIYDYDRKTEVIITSGKELPQGQQITLKAYIQSCADVFYKIKNDTLSRTEDINNGYAHFYLDENKLGKVLVKNGKAELPLFLSSRQENYNLGEHTLKVKYEPTEKYFKSEGTSKIKIINQENICYVSKDGNDNSNGTFAEPFATIQKAVDSNRQTIYIKPGNYNLSEIINIDSKKIIKRYDEEVIFDNNDLTIFSTTKPLTLEGLTFTNNHNLIINSTSNLSNEVDLTIKECIFYKNDTPKIMNHIGDAYVTKSVFVENNIITQNTSKCNFYINWFGTNTPRQQYSTMNDYVVMTIDQSKDVILMNSVVRLTAAINHYEHIENDQTTTIKLDEPLPLRIANFISNLGSFMPVRDYTHNNKSVTLFNTKEKSNSDIIILTLPENKNYVGQPIILECYAEDALGNKLEDGTIIFRIEDEKRNIPIKDGVATLNSTIHNIFLSRGEHYLECVYNGKNSAKVGQTFVIQSSDIKVKDFFIEEGDHLRDLKFNLSLVDSFDQPIEKQTINIYIDDELIEDKVTKNGNINTTLTYPKLSIGSHTLKFKTKYDDQYEPFEYITSFYVSKRDTRIHFNYNSIAPGYVKDLIVQVVTSRTSELVQGGQITSVLINNEVAYENLDVMNGMAILKDFCIEERGQCSIAIHYGGNAEYNQSVYITNDFFVGVKPVNIDINSLEVESNKKLKISFPIYDDTNHIINRGNVNFLIDGIPFNDDPIKVNFNGYVKYSNTLPIGTQTGNHILTIIYDDDANNTIYAETTKEIPLKVLPITTIIRAPNSVTAHPEQEIKLDIQVQYMYEGEEQYRTVNQGNLTISYNDSGHDVIIETKSLTSPINDSITFTLPLLEANNYNLKFNYEDPNGIYKNSTASTYLEINKSPVNIEITPTRYYPSMNFDLKVICKNDKNEYVETGSCILYIDNIQYKEPVIVNNGIATFSDMIFEQVRDYNLRVIFEEDLYYQKSVGEAIFKIKDIPIKNIKIFDNESNEEIFALNSQPEKDIEFGIQVIDVNDNKANDGYLDFYLGNKHIGTYLVSENEIDFISLRIPKLNKGDNYSLLIKFHDSNIYEEYEKEYAFTIDEPDLSLSITPNPINADFNGIIDIIANIEPNINGTLEFYLWPNNNSSTKRFIGIDQINNRNHVPFRYTLPPLDQSEHKIEVVLLANEEYNTHSATANLHIEKRIIEPIDNLTINDVIYQETLTLDCNINLDYNGQVTFYIDNHFFTTGLINQGHIHLEKQLDSSFNVGTHTLTMSIDGTSTLDSFTQEISFRVLPRDPILPVTYIEEFIGNFIALPTYVLDNFNNKIEVSSIHYEDEEGHRLTQQTEVQPNMRKIFVYCTIDNNNFNDYIDSPLEISIYAKKNNIKVEIDNTGPITRGEPFIEEITVTSTSYHQPNLYIIFEDEVIPHTTNTIEITPSLSLPDKEYYNLIISVNENEIFNAYSKTFKIHNKNKDTIDISTDDYTIDKIFDLIADYGVINLDHDIDNPEQIEVINNKHITINGNGHYISKLNIINDESLIINDLTLKDSNKTAITTNGSLFAYHCTFENNYSNDCGGAIYIDNRNDSTVIKECCFNNNNASLYGGAIYSNKGNDITLEGNHFTQNGHDNISGASISVNGNIYLSRNMFYDNIGKSEIHILNGVFEAENNYFDGSLTYDIDNSLMYTSYETPYKTNFINDFIRIYEREPLENEIELEPQDVNEIYDKINEKVKCDLNYFGYNTEENIDNKLLNAQYNSYLISHCDIEYKEPTLGQIEKHITPRINQYRLKTEIETTTSENVIGNVPVPAKIIRNGHNVTCRLNEEYTTTAQDIELKIGQEKFRIGDNQ